MKELQSDTSIVVLPGDKVRSAVNRENYLEDCLDHTNQRRIQREGAGGPRSPYFLQSTVIFCNHFKALQTVLSEVELIINNAPLTYVYTNTIEECLTLNHLLFCRQLLYSSNTTLTVVRNLTVI